MLASVVICTYNRSDLLQSSLLSVVAQDLDHDDFEVIVVDNNSSDDTRLKVQEIASSSPVKVSYVFQAQQGLSSARNAGIKAANGDIVVFTDDDIEADKEWLRNLVAVFDSADVACAGGPIRPAWPSATPSWLTREWESYLTVSEFEAARETGEFGEPHYPWGANIAFSKDVFEWAGVFPTDLGRVGNMLLSNEEINLCRKIAKSARKIRFAPNAIIHHKIPPERLTKLWFYHRTFYQGVSDAVLDNDTGANVYLRLRALVSNLFHEDAANEVEAFNKECRNRIALGYLYGILSSSKPRSKFSDLRLLATSLSVVLNNLRTFLLEKESEVAARTQWAITLDNELTAQNERVANLQQELQDRTAWATTLKEENQLKDARIASLQQELLDRTQWAMTLRQEVEQKDERIVALQQEFTERTEWALRLKDSVEERDARIGNLQQELAEQTSQVQELKDELNRKISIFKRRK